MKSAANGPCRPESCPLCQRVDGGSKRLPEAIAVLRQAVELNPEELDAWTALAAAYEAQGNRTEAEKAAERVEALRRQQEAE